jgi:hypothetical protein
MRPSFVDERRSAGSLSRQLGPAFEAGRSSRSLRLFIIIRVLRDQRNHQTREGRKDVADGLVRALRAISK